MEQKNNLTLGSLFDGSGGFPLGGMLCGITPVWASEIEPFPIRVTTKRLLFMKHYGDVSKINGADLEPVDIITFGSPCTDMSVAGKRAGLDGQQSVLFYQAIRIVKEMRCATNGNYPRYIVWENVFGAFSSSAGADFKAVLEAVIGVVQPETEVPAPDGFRWPYADIYMGDGWSVAYRTVDAQYFGVPQRRRRIYLVADFAGACAGEILFEREGVSRDYSPSGNPWQRTAADAEDGAGASGFGVDGYNSFKAATLGVNCGMSTGRNGVVLNDQGGDRMNVSYERTDTLRAEAHHSPCVMQSSGFCTEHSAKSRSVGYEEERSPTLRAGVVPGVAIENHPTDGRCKVSAEEKCPTLMSRDFKDAPVVGQPAYGIDRAAFNQGANAQYTPAIDEEQQPTLTSRGPGAVAQPASFYPQMKAESQCFRQDGTANTLVNGTNPGYQNGLVEPTYIVRRLTPTECARLQGFPDWWCDALETDEPTEDEIAFWTEVWETHRRIVGTSEKPKSQKQIIKWLRHPHSDAAEYKMWGNGVALPCVCFVLTGIVLCTQDTAE